MGTVNDPIGKFSGRVGILMSRDDARYQWDFSLSRDGSTMSIDGLTAELAIDGLSNLRGQMTTPARIEKDEEIVLYWSVFGNGALSYDEDMANEGSGYPAAFFIKCRFS